jgi:1-aminocyclopropane-1-carboxylate deaminase/D-cysteine desulfhydrase-like pyridoxal-dependent ACC family enzyme
VKVRAISARWPRLTRTLPHVDLRVEETPLELWEIGGVSLLVKRDDLTTPTLGGNKARALEHLLAGVGPDDRLLTVGSTGSTHALSVAHFAARLGAPTYVVTWPQEDHDVARATAARLATLATVMHAGSPVEAMARATLRRFTSRVRWIPSGGTSALGALGHVNAAIELDDQLKRDGYLAPETLVVPLGTGGTAAGLLVGLALAGLRTRVIGVRVVPRIVANRTRVLRLARSAASLFGRLAGVDAPRIDDDRLVIDEQQYGGAYARETDASREAEALAREMGGPALEGTYSAKALAAALAYAQRTPDERVLFWLTFDGRWLGEGATSASDTTTNGGE